MDDIVTKRYHLSVTDKDTVHPPGALTECGYVYPLLNTMTGFSSGHDNYSTDVWSGTIHGQSVQVVLRSGRASDLHESYPGDKLYVTSEKPLTWHSLRAWDLPEGAVTPLRTAIGKGPVPVPKVMTLTKSDHWSTLLRGMGLRQAYAERVLKLLVLEPEFSSAYASVRITDEVQDLISDSLSDQDEEDELEDSDSEEEPEEPSKITRETLVFGALPGSDDDELSGHEPSEDEEETLVSPSDGMLSTLPSITEVNHSDYCPSEPVTISSGLSPLELLAKPLPMAKPDPGAMAPELLVKLKLPKEFLELLERAEGKPHYYCEAYRGAKEQPTKKKKNRHTVLRTDVLSEEVLGRARKSMLVEHVVDPRGRTRAGRAGKNGGSGTSI